MVGRDVEKVLLKGLKFIAGRGMDGGVETCTSALTKEAQGLLPSVGGVTSAMADCRFYHGRA